VPPAANIVGGVSAESQRDARGSLPNLVVIGAQKCGTSSLHYYLSLHPEVFMSSPKELDFFADAADVDALPDPSTEDRAVVAPLRGNWGRGEAWYRSHFRGTTAPVRGESSPSYTAPWHPGCAQRLAGLIPDAKLIALVRDPFTQIPSAWQHQVASGRETRDLSRAVRPGGVYVERARYRARLEPFLEAFGSERLLVLSQDSLHRERPGAMRRAFEFCGVEPSFYSPRMDRLRHVTAGKSASRRMLERLQGRPVTRPAYGLPGEVKWMVERALSRRGGGDAPELESEVRDWLAMELGPDAAWLAAEFGIDTSGWLR
jgi:hypothetical protein